jgi:hypothetical protein
MLSNFDLEDMARDAGFDLIGVFSKDKLPIQKRAGSYIVNLEDHDAGGGTHWVAFKLFDNAKVCYYDSFGFVAPKDVTDWLKKFQPIATNNRHIQDMKSDKCGYFCMAFIAYFHDFDVGKSDVFESYDDFLNCFSSDEKVNDRIVMDLLKHKL